MSDSLTIDECQDALLSLSRIACATSSGIPSDFIVVHQPQPQVDMQEKLQAPTAHFDLENEYDSYINAAFRPSKEGQAYLFVGTEYVVFDYSQGPSHAEVVKGPLPICNGFPFLKFTFFVDYELNAAFGSGENEAIFFLGDECAKINYSSNPSHEIKQITEMFPFLQCTPFECSIDAALESWKSNEAFLFKDDQCVCINYSSDNCSLVGTIRPIVELFPILKDTFFDSGIQAACAKSITNCYCYEAAGKETVVAGSTLSLQSSVGAGNEGVPCLAACAASGSDLRVHFKIQAAEKRIHVDVGMPLSYT
ncbi:hypothetical protein RHMOL_Rhmol10G0231600 [Rhododendron molle]|uniref:Uncharacterized protein n=1 Tax=Rhododendron molle TaxID=49168 RepID=A0ACC0M6C0_RHOML|nr:hypothetical protein RHMOL_Rhmol10G0231600 [Rhododendron molle]